MRTSRIDPHSPLTESSDGVSLVIGGFVMRVDLNGLGDIPIQVAVPAIPEPLLLLPPLPLPWYRRFWHFLNLDVRDIWRDYIRSYFR